MRAITIITALALAATACGNQTESSQEGTPAVAPGTTSALVAGANVLARLGGILIPAQSYHVELLPKSDGKVEAVIIGADGNVVAGGADVTLAVKVTGADGALHDVTLAWSPEHERYVGSVDGGVAVTQGPAEVTVTAGGAAHAGRVDTVQVAAAPAHGGAVVVTGDYSVELIPSDEKVIAYVVDVQGRPVDVSAGAELNVTVGAPGATQDVTLTWDAAEGHYKGMVEGGANLEVAPVGVVFVHGGRRHAGRIVHVGRSRAAARLDVVAEAGGVVRIVTPEAQVNVGGDIDVVGPEGHVRITGGGLHGRGAINVQGPGGHVVVNPGQVHVRTPGANVHVPAGGVTVRGTGPSGAGRVVVGGPGGVVVGGPGGNVVVGGPGGVVVGGGSASAMVVVGGGARVAPPPPPPAPPSGSAMVTVMGGASIGGSGGIQIGH